MNSEAKQRAKELVEFFAPIMPNEDCKKKAKECALKVAKSEWDVLEKARVFEQHDYYLELFNEIVNY